jgi:hypothetical protein
VRLAGTERPGCTRYRALLALWRDMGRRASLVVRATTPPGDRLVDNADTFAFAEGIGRVRRTGVVGRRRADVAARTPPTRSPTPATSTTWLAT